MAKRRGRKSGAGISINGNVDTGGGDIAAGDIQKGDVYQSHGVNASELKELFLPIYRLIDEKKALPAEDREDLKTMVGEIQAEAGKGKARDETFIERQLRNIARMAPDILEVTLHTIASPALGLASLAQKISKKAGESGSAEEAVKKK